MDNAAISEALENLWRADVKRQVFGADVHDWKIAPPCGEGEVDAFEERYRVRLPEDYRSFLLEVSNGGAGPYNGLLPLGVFSDIRWGGSDSWEADFARPFPHREAWNLAPEPHPPAKRGKHLPKRPTVSGEAAYDAWLERLFDKAWIHGAIPISYDGFGNCYLLVVTGPERGHVWNDCRSNEGGIAPARPDEGDEERQTFLEWYVAWLQRALRLCAKQ